MKLWKKIRNIGGIKIWTDPERHPNRWSRPLEFEVTEPGWYDLYWDYYQRKGTSALIAVPTSEIAAVTVAGSPTEVVVWGGEPVLRLAWLQDVTRTFLQEARRAGKTPSGWSASLSGTAVRKRLAPVSSTQG